MATKIKFFSLNISSALAWSSGGGTGSRIKALAKLTARIFSSSSLRLIDEKSLPHQRNESEDQGNDYGYRYDGSQNKLYSYA